MTFEIKKKKGTYVDKATGVTKTCTHFILVTPSGRGIQIRTAFKDDLHLLDVLVPLETAEDKGN